MLETFVDPQRFTGSSYRAVNWLEVGTSAGRRDGIPKTVLVYPLTSRWRPALCEARQPPLGKALRPEQQANRAGPEFGHAAVHYSRLS